MRGKSPWRRFSSATPETRNCTGLALGKRRHRQLLLLLLLTLSWFSANLSAAKEEDLAKLALSKRAAVLRMTVWRTAQEKEVVQWGIGVFISKDGLALVNLQGLVTEKIPTVEIAGEKKLKLGKILGVFPEQELALVKFDHRPKTWAPLAQVEPELGETIALLPLKPGDQWNGKIPPVIGPVTAKRSAMTPNLRVMRFTKVLSLGSGLLPAQRAGLGPGCFAIDRQGRLVTFTNGTGRAGRQTIIELAPVAHLAGRIQELAKDDQDLGFPLPRAHNPIDPAALDPAFHPMNLATAQQDWKEVQRLLNQLQRRHPKSHLLKLKGYELKLQALQGKIKGDPLQRFPKPNPKDPIAHQVSVWSARATLLLGRGQLQAAIAEFEAAVALGPVDYPDNRAALAMLYASQNRNEDAEKLLSQVYPFSADSIAFVETYERFLLDQGKFKEVQKMTDRIFELEEIYKRPR